MSLLVPKRVKYRKTQRGSRKGNATRNSHVTAGSFGLQAIERAWMKNREIEAARVAINRALNKKGKMWIKVFPHKPVTARPPETRMGKGKGQPEFWVAVIRPGTILFEIDGVNEVTAREAFRLAANKLSFRCRFVARNREVKV